MINDNQNLIGAYTVPDYDDTIRYPLKTYDDAFGPLWVYSEAHGPMGVVRAQSFEAAYEICQDEIMDRVPDEPESIAEAFGFYVMEHQGEYWLCPDDDDMPGSYWESFGGSILGSQVLGDFDSRREAARFAIQLAIKHDLELVEGYEYQSNGTGSGIVSYDPNGQSLDELTSELAEQLGIRVQVEER